MIRVILAEIVQVGPDSWERVYKSVDVDVPVVEALLSTNYTLIGIERLPAPQRPTGEGE